MADTKISALTAAPYMVGSEAVPIVDAGGANEKATVAQINAGALIYLNADYTLTSTTSTQKIFDTTANGRLTISEAGLYTFEMLLAVTGMSATAGNAVVDILGAGTAVLGGQLFQAVGVDNNLLTVVTARGGSGALGTNNITGSNMVTPGTGTQLLVHVAGVFKVTTTGTMIPSITLNTAAAALVKAGSYFQMRKLAADSIYSVGAWD